MSVAHISLMGTIDPLGWDGCDFCCFFGRLLGLTWPSIHLPPQRPGGLAGILGLCWCKKRPWSRGTFSSSSTGWENFVGLEMKSLLNRS